MVALWKAPNADIDAMLAEWSPLALKQVETLTVSRAVEDQGPYANGDPVDVVFKLGLEIAHEIARLDLGQTIVVRGQACVAIEAMEGTDETILRAGRLAKGRLTVVKVAKPNQDMRFDVPVVGVPTIEAMIEAGATCLCITAGKTLMFDRNQMIRTAEKNKISILAADLSDF